MSMNAYRRRKASGRLCVVSAGSYPYRLTLALAAPIPEPPVCAMVALGLAGLRCWRRRRG